MKKIDTLKLGAAMLVMGPFLLLLDMVYFFLPFNIVNLPVINAILINLPGSGVILHLISFVVASSVYIAIAGFLLLIRHHFKVETGNEKIFRFVDYALALYIALELLITGLMFFLIPYANNLPGPYIGFIYWLIIFRGVLATGFMFFWTYGLFRGYGKMALLFSLCFFVLVFTPFIPYNNTDFFEQQDAYYEEQRAAMPEDYEVTYVKESELDLDEMTIDSENGVTVVVPDQEETIKTRVIGPGVELGRSIHLLILAYTWLRFSRQLFTKSQPQPEQEQPESA